MDEHIIYNIAFITLYAKNNDKWIFSERAEGIINFFLNKGHNIFVIKLDKNIGEGFYEKAIHVNKNKLVTINIRNLDCINFNWVGKGINKLNINSCLNDELKYFTKFLNFIQDNNIKKPIIINPIKSLLANISKKYYFEFKDKLPFLSSTIINSVDQLIKYSQHKEIFIAKPLISERSKGTVILNNMNKNEIIEYFKKYNCSDNYQKFKNKNKLYYEIMKEQKIIVQPFCDYFSKYGEKKISIINGEVSFSRKVISKKDGIIPNFYKGTSIDLYYKPTENEIIFAKKVYAIFKSIYSISYMRLDIISSENNFYINEIEIINPDWAEIDKLQNIDENTRINSVNKLRSLIYNSIINKIKRGKSLM